MRSSRTLLVVGHGMVAQRFCEELRARDPERLDRIVVFGEEPRAAYDRVHLTRFFEERSEASLRLAAPDWFETHGVTLRTGCCVVAIDRDARTVTADDGSTTAYDVLVLCTGSSAFVPPIPGVDRPGVFVYRTIEDLERILAWSDRADVSRAAVLGGGLLGLEAARAVQLRGLEAHVVELAPHLMARQLDARGGAVLRHHVEALGVHVHVGVGVVALEGEGDEPRVRSLRRGDGEALDAEMVVVSAGIRPRDELARDAGLTVGPRGGVVVDDGLATSDPHVFAIGEVALHRGVLHGLVAPGYAMATVLARRLLGEDVAFEGADASCRLKLMGVDVAVLGDPHADGRALVWEDGAAGVYQKLVLATDADRILGASFVGDAAPYARVAHLVRSGEIVASPARLLVGEADGDAELPDEAAVCSCHDVDAGTVRACVRAGASSCAEIGTSTKAGAGCGGCVPLVNDLLKQELARAGRSVSTSLCEHFAMSRQELYTVCQVTGIRDFETLLARHGRGRGCEVCKPTAASVFASLEGEMILARHATLQDTNDRYLANIQRQGLYSIVPRIPGGEITPRKLMVLARVAERYGLYTKITGGQRIDLFGAKLEQLPDIWEELVAEGFESGHAYAKGMRTVKSCVGSTWCRFGVQDSVAFAIAIEHRYKGLRTPHKLKSAVSGCVRECAEAQSKDFGLVATDKGWNLYVGGNGGASPRHADRLATDVDADTAVRLVDRFLMFYVRTADKLQRTSTWLDKLPGGIEHLRAVVVDDSLGLAAELESQMQALVDAYECEWAAVVRDPEQRARFRHFADGESEEPRFVIERGQRRPEHPEPPKNVIRLPILRRSWVPVAQVSDVPVGAGTAFRHGEVQLALHHHESGWFAIDNRCPHRGEELLSRGLSGDADGEPKVACPMHKRTFSLIDGRGLSDPSLQVATFPTRVEGGTVWVELPPAAELAAALCRGGAACDAAE
ncbi:MAG: nitrite reductase small subunit NirD [Sandaracinus sp.]|nr:nitrite reductase small subunit NirD [Sandaracinus sp.]